jgi:hypothetical protein
MSAASPAQTQVRRTATAAPSRAPQAAPQQQAAPAPVRQAANSQAFDFSTPKGDEEIRLNLSDLPVMRGTLEVEGFKPSLLSKLFDLIAPLKR